MQNPEELLKQAQALIEEKKYQEVIDLLSDEVLEIVKDDTIKADLYAEKATAYSFLVKYEESKNVAEKALAINPKQVKALMTVSIYFAAKYDDFHAEKYLQNLTEINPKFAKLNYFRPENNYLIEKEFEKDIENEPNSTIPYIGLSYVYITQKNYDKALSCLEKAIEIGPANAEHYYNIGVIYSIKKDYDKALEFYQKSELPDAFNNIGNIYAHKKEYDKAIDNFKIAIDKNPKNPKPYNGLGSIYYIQTNYDKAIEYFNKATNIDPKFAEPYYNLGLAYSAKKNYKDAIINFQWCVDHSKNRNDYLASSAQSQIKKTQMLLESDITDELNQIWALIIQIKNLLYYNQDGIIHYTGLTTAKALVFDKSPFRLSEGTFLNDTSEGRELFKFLSYSSAPEEENNSTTKTFVKKPFIGSFVLSNKDNDLTLWRMYGKENKVDAGGCAIKIDQAKLIENFKNKLNLEKVKIESIENEFRFYRVAYRQVIVKKGEKDKNKFIIPGLEEKEDELNEYMEKLFQTISSIQSNEKTKPDEKLYVVEMLNEIAFLFKSVEYQYEHEVRLILKDNDVYKKEIDSKSATPKVYIELVPVKDLIQKITFGPKVERPDEWVAAFYYSFSEDNLSPEIRISQLPFK